MFNILIIEDDKNTRRLFEDIIKDEGYHPLLAVDGIAALKIMETHHVDLIIVDVMMPRMDGIEFTKLLRDSKNNIPLLMVTAMGESADIKRGFRVGIDDYMVKPIDDEEMILRIKALLRRSKSINEKRLIIGKLELDYNAFVVTYDYKSKTLPKKEFLLLFKLLSFPEHIFTKFQLMEEIWGMDSDSDDNTVNVHINKLRTKFKECQEFEIVTMRGLGYKGC